MTRASRFLAALDACLPPERHQHGRVERMAETIADANGGIGRPFQADSALDTMLRRGTISVTQHLAGNTFRSWFYRAGLDPLRATDAGQRIAASYGTNPVAVEHARRRVNAALEACGGLRTPCGSVVWHCLGLEASLAEWSRRQGWAGRPVRHESARLVLVGALGVLAVHFRIERG